MKTTYTECFLAILEALKCWTKVKTSAVWSVSTHLQVCRDHTDNMKSPLHHLKGLPILGPCYNYRDRWLVGKLLQRIPHLFLINVKGGSLVYQLMHTYFIFNFSSDYHAYFILELLLLHCNLLSSCRNLWLNIKLLYTFMYKFCFWSLNCSGNMSKCSDISVFGLT